MVHHFFFSLWCHMGIKQNATMVFRSKIVKFWSSLIKVKLLDTESLKFLAMLSTPLSTLPNKKEAHATHKDDDRLVSYVTLWFLFSGSTRNERTFRVSRISWVQRNSGMSYSNTLRYLRYVIYVTLFTLCRFLPKFTYDVILHVLYCVCRVVLIFVWYLS